MIFEHASHICLYLQWFWNMCFIFACFCNGSGARMSAFACIYNEFEAWNRKSQDFASIYNGFVAFLFFWTPTYYVLISFYNRN